MKKIHISIIMIVMTLTSFSQTGKQIPEGPCPDGECSYGVSIVFDQFNFHKPRTSCTSGFGLCIKVHTEPICEPCPMGYPTPDNMKTDISDGKVKAWWKLADNKIELHIPVDLQKVDGYGDVDFSLFEIDDESFIIDNQDKTIYATVKGGQYKVTKQENDFVVLLEIVK